MFKKTLLSLFLVAAVSQAAVKELIPNLTSSDLDVQAQARLDLLSACSKASRPDASEADRKAICLEMCKVLEGNHPVVSVLQPVLNNLERIGGEESVPTLAKLMSHKDEHIRDDARRALVVNPSPAAGQALGTRLKMRKARSAKETAGLIYALGERKEAGASKLIAAQLSSKSDIVFLAAVKALGTLNEKDGIRALAKRRVWEKDYRLMQLNAALFQSDNPAVFKKLYAETEPDQVRAVALLGLLLGGENGFAAAVMASGNSALQTALIEAALQGKDIKVCDAVATNLGSLPAYLQVRALGALEFSENRVYAKRVEPLLQSPDGNVQNAASQALARIGTPNSVLPLIANGTPAARRALGLLNTEGVDKALEAEAAKKGDDSRRSVAIDALSIRGRQDLIPTFFVFVVEGGKETAASAANAIGQIGDLSNLEQLTQLMIAKEKEPVSRDVLNAIVEIMRQSIDPAKAVDILVARMDGASPRSQANILQALAQTDHLEALHPLATACRSSDEQLQKSAVKMLSGWKSENGLPSLIELASDDALSLVNHVTLMRGISRILAGQKPWKVNETAGQQALEACRRDEERQMIQAVIDKFN